MLPPRVRRVWATARRVLDTMVRNSAFCASSSSSMMSHRCAYFFSNSARESTRFSRWRVSTRSMRRQRFCGNPRSTPRKRGSGQRAVTTLPRV